MTEASSFSAMSAQYTPVCSPSVPHRHSSQNPSFSIHKAHYRRLYDVYQLCVQRGNVQQAKRAYSLLVRCKEFDWATNWRSGIEMVDLGEEDAERMEVDGVDEEMRERVKRIKLADLQVQYLRECHAAHSRKARKSHSLREPQAILLELVLLLARTGRHQEALSELELYLPVYPYKDDAVLHEHAGMLAMYLAQFDANLQNLTKHGLASLSSSDAAGAARKTPNPSSTSSSTSSSVTSSPADKHDPKQIPVKSATSSPPNQKAKRRKKHATSRQSVRTFFKLPSVGLVQRIVSESPNFAMEARRYYERAVLIASEQGRVAEAAQLWIGLMDGRAPSDAEDTLVTGKATVSSDVSKSDADTDNSESSSASSSLQGQGPDSPAR